MFVKIKAKREFLETKHTLLSKEINKVIKCFKPIPIPSPEVPAGHSQWTFGSGWQVAIESQGFLPGAQGEIFSHESPLPSKSTGQGPHWKIILLWNII